MMNNKLKKEIIKHILYLFGVENNMSLSNIINDSTVIDKKISFVDEFDNKTDSNIYAVKSSIDDSTLKIIIANLSDDETKEYAMIMRLDDLLIYGLKFNFDESTDGDFCVGINDNWTDADTCTQANLLYGMEQASNFIKWNKLDDYNEMYKLLISFLNAKA